MTPDPLTATVVGITWLIIINKPIYPLYVWWLVGSGTAAACWTIASVPFYAVVPWLARRSTFGARIAFPLIAFIDTIFEAKLFGAGSAAELFAAPCALIAALSFRAEEARWSRGILAILYVGFLAAHGHLGTAIHIWPEDGLATLREINTVAVASLTVFVGWRFARAK